MQWLALACTAENEILAWSTELSTLESACLGEFQAICRVYGVQDLHANQLKQFNLDFKLKFDGPRNTEFVAHRKSMETSILSQQLQSRVGLMVELQQRLSHGFKRFQVQYPWQQEAYFLKYQQALNVLAVDYNNGPRELIEDYAEEAGLDVFTAASLIANKYENRVTTIRKLERLRIRFQRAIRSAKNKEEFAQVRAQMDEDSFLSMMM
jgi:hypothetical protein